MRKFLAFVLAASLFLTPIATAAKDQKLVEQVKSAVALLYSQDEAGGLRMHCTATAFEQDSKTVDKVKTITGYHFATAAHCIGGDNTDKERSADTKNTPFYITFDESGTQPKKFYPAKPKFVGYQSRGEDFAEFEVATGESWGTVPLGDEKQAKDGDDFINVSSPLGLGKQTFHGQISSISLDRPLMQGDINWRGTIVLQITGINGGSSGSAIVHEDQHAIIGFLVGSIGGSTIVAIPVSRFIAVRKAVAEKHYKYYSPTADLNPDGSVK